MREYQAGAIDRAKAQAMQWLEANGEGFPRSREQEDKRTAHLGYEMYDDWEAPPIIGYEALEADGCVTRKETVKRKDGEERVRFVLKA